MPLNQISLNLQKIKHFNQQSPKKRFRIKKGGSLSNEHGWVAEAEE